MKYREICPQCGAPARLALLANEAIGIEEFVFCQNPGCLFYDRNTIEAEKRRADEAVRQTKSFKRHQSKLWKSEFRKAAEGRKRNRARIHANTAGLPG